MIIRLLNNLSIHSKQSFKAKISVFNNINISKFHSKSTKINLNKKHCYNNLFKTNNNIILKNLNLYCFNEVAKPKKFYKEVNIIQEESFNYNISECIEDNNYYLNCFINNNNNNKYNYLIKLDNRTLKTRYLEELKIPTKQLAMAIGEEWINQKEHINYHSMTLYNLFSAGSRLKHDKDLYNQSVNKLIPFIETDQIIYSENKIISYLSYHYNVDLKKSIKSIIEFFNKNILKDISNNEFSLKLKENDFFENNKYIEQYYNNKIKDKKYILFDKSNELMIFNTDNIDNHSLDHIISNKLENKLVKKFSVLNPYTIALLENLCGYTKSLSLSIGLLREIITPKEVYLISHSEELFQMIINGEVEGHHDLLQNSVQGNINAAIVFYKLFNYFN